MEETKKKFDFSKYGLIAGFLSYEVFAIIAFSLAQSFLLYAIMSLVLVIAVAVCTKRQIDKDGWSNYLFFVFPILIFGVLTAISYFSSSPYVNASTIVIRIFIPICFASLALMGCLLPKIEGFKIKYVILAIYSALALYCLINLAVTMFQFVPFYTLKYGDAFIYYKGKPSPVPVADMAYVLNSFEMETVSVDYFSFFPSILSTSVIALFYIDPKKELKQFVLYALYAFIGIISLLFTPTIMTLITDFLIIVAVLIIVLAGKGIIKSKTIKYGIITISIILGVGLLVIVLNAQSNFTFVHKITSSNKLFDKLFNANHIIASWNDVLDGLFSTNKLFGFPPYYDTNKYLNIWPSGSWFVDLFMTSGVLGYIFFIYILYTVIKAAFIYCQKDSDSIKDKSLLIALLVVILGYSMINYDAKPFVYSDMVDSLLTRGPFILVFFICGYIYSRSNTILEEEKKHNNVQENEQKEVEVVI